MSGLSGPFSMRRPGHCVRCKEVVEATWPWSGWGTLKRFHYAGIALLVCLSPFFYADMIVMLPSALVFVSAVGAVNTLARIKPTCLRCGGVVAPPASALH